MPRSVPAEPPAVPLTDGVVTVRQRRASDVDAAAEASRDPESRRWLTDPPTDGPIDDTVRTSSLARVTEVWRTGRGAPLVVADAATDEPVGLVNLQFRDDATAAVAYSVFPAHRGRGIARRAVDLVVAWAFGDLGVTEVLLEADEANAASIRVAEKGGFERTGTRAEADRTMLVFARSSPDRR